MLKSFKLLACLALTFASGMSMASSVIEDAQNATKKARKGPAEAPIRSITNFSEGLRCMDKTFTDYGVRDIVVISEDINDQTKKVNVGTRDMLINAVSEMTKRSRAIRLIAYGADTGNLASFIDQRAEKKGLVQLMPKFGIRGSISQLDENVAKRTEGGGISIGSFFSFGRATTASGTILGLDLTMMRTEDFSIIPGVTSSNSVAIFKSGTGNELEAGYSKLGINYQSNLSQAEGNAQAMRNLVEMAAIELFGKLTKTPYWSCLGADSKSDMVKTEIADWFDSMYNAPDGELVSYWQEQFRIRGLYQGEIDGNRSDELVNAINAYGQAMGLGDKSGAMNVDYLTAYLSADHKSISPKARTILASMNAATAKPAPTEGNSPIELAIDSTKGGNQFKRGENVILRITPNRDAYVYCFMQDESKKIARFFPNRFSKDPLVSFKRGLMLPSGKEFSISASDKGMQEHVACFATNKDVFSDVVTTIGGGDIDTPTAAKSFDELKSVFDKAAGQSVGMTKFTVDVR